ncbi:MAG: asparagine synthase (glutamine-hydrolyzing) [Cyanobacteria bacterium]|nr:asparagine synthase (glutamine-hydrolyzing) [Cyanobacteriota bacterium]
MCGIAGLIGRSPGDFAVRVGPKLAHRGPDSAGLWHDESTCLLHRRLAILDLSPAGHQPMASACGRWQLVFNGEIYNHIQLRRQLEALGLVFTSSSDTEVLLAWLIRHGSAGLDDLRGMFALALFDRQERTALLARDPNGIKPLYYWQGDSGELAFASELRALLASDLIPRQPDVQAICHFLATGSVVEPATLVAGVRRLPAGHLARWRAGELQIEPWCPIPESLPFSADGSSILSIAAVARTREALESSVAAHMVSDVPVGLFLSAGLDSASLLALAPRGLRTFTIGFPEQGAEALDEAGPAARIASQFSAHHTPLALTASEARAWIPDFLKSQDQPSIDGFNTWCVSRLARAQGIKVVLSGLGGDELFGGYPSFRQIPRMQRWHRRLGSLSPMAGHALRRLPNGQQSRQQRLADWLEHDSSEAAAHRCFRGLFAPREIARLMSHWGLDDSDFSSGIKPEPPGLCSADGVAWLEGTTYLRNQLLPDSDVMAMAHGLELRLPLVDASLQRELAPLPAPLRLAPGKELLRRAVPELPNWFLDRPKQGFRFPFQLWLDDPASPLSLGLPSAPSGVDLRPWYRRWALMVLQHWFQEHLLQPLESHGFD